MTNRDEFSAAVKRAVALRAGYHCSFSGCHRLTVGPSDESPGATASIGVAAHIHAAAPGEGARRYLASMTPAQRAHIDNAVWMCATHATLIDRDEVTYTADALRKMKADHERSVAAQLAVTVQGETRSLSLVALGTEIIATGEVIGTAGVAWTIRLDHFVSGDVDELIRMGEGFHAMPRDERFVLVNALGDGRVLDCAPVWRKEGGAIVVTATVQARFPRSSAKGLGTDLKLVNGDLAFVDGDLATVSGVDALPQKIQLCLWHQKGDTSSRNGSDHASANTMHCSPALHGSSS